MKIQPFFSRYLETQNAELTTPKTSTTLVTMRYPSDNEDGGSTGKPGNGLVTLKYPSDNEDGGSLKAPGFATTMKYPSDGEDGGVNLPGKMVTLKFPSDNEDGGDKCSEPSAKPSSWTDRITDMLKELQDLLKSLLSIFGGGSSPQPAKDIVTLKFPSDQEDGGCR